MGCYYISTLLPKGNRASFISLKCCIPKGIPTMVMQNTTPHNRCVKAIGTHPTNHHITFMIPARQPDGHVPSVIFVPKGHRATFASLSVCSPNGIPMMVIIMAILDIRYSMAIITPPNTNQIMLSNIFISNFLFLYITSQSNIMAKIISLFLSESKSFVNFTSNYERYADKTIISSFYRRS